jgi:hypothetical protein
MRANQCLSISSCNQAFPLASFPLLCMEASFAFQSAGLASASPLPTKNSIDSPITIFKLVPRPPTLNHSNSFENLDVWEFNKLQTVCWEIGLDQN